MRIRVARWLVLALAAGGLALWSATAEEKSSTLPADLQWVPVKSAVLVSLKPALLWNSELGKSLREKMGKDVTLISSGVEKELGLSPAKIERLTVVVPQLRAANDPMAFVAATEKLDRKALLGRLLPTGAKEKSYAGQTVYVGNRNRAVVWLGDSAFLVGNDGDIQSTLEAKKPREGTGLSAAVRLAAGKHAVVAAVNREAITDFKEEDLPEELAVFKPLLKASLGTITLDLGEKAEVRAQAHFAAAGDAAAALKPAEAAQAMAVGGLARGVRELGADRSAAALVAMLGDVQAAVKAAKVQQQGTTLTADIAVKLEPKTLAGVASQVAEKARQSAQRAVSQNNLKQFGIALHNYHDANNSFPPHAIYDKDGKAVLSWRVLLLPYLGEQELYNQFKLDEAWDSPHNKKLLAKMPKVFKDPTGQNKQPFGTFYQAFVGKDAAFEGKRGVQFFTFTDGTSNTIMVAEAAKDVPWTKPEDLDFDAAQPLPKLGGIFKEGANTLFADGSVRFLPRTLKPEILKLLITRNDGQPIPAF